MAVMNLRFIRFALLALAVSWSGRTVGQQVPAAKNARILLVPRKMITGDRTTLAALDMSGRLTPGVTIAFSNGDHVTTNSTGRDITPHRETKSLWNRAFFLWLMFTTP